MSELEQAIEKIGWAPTPSDGPGTQTWQQLVAKFATRGYARLLVSTEAETVALEFAHPSLETSTLLRKLPAWKEVENTIQCESADDWFALLIQINKLVDIIASDDDVEESVTSLFGDSEEDVEDEATDDGFETIGDKPESDSKTDAPSEDKNDIASVESGDSPEFGYELVEKGDVVHVGIGLGTSIDAGRFGRFEETILRNLRAKYDVSPSAITRKESEAKLKHNFKHELHLAVKAEGSTTAAVGQIADYLAKIEDLAQSGIDPLVFLGVVRTATQEVPAIQKPLEPEPDPTPDAFVLFSEEDSSETSLKPGNFEDSRLRNRDSSASIVDVVLRHPGYSDRNMGQVLSLLLSIEYHNAQEIIAKAPTVIAWDVARERALTMKTVIEGAGGKVHMSEPGTFGVE